MKNQRKNSNMLWSISLLFVLAACGQKEDKVTDDIPIEGDTSASPTGGSESTTIVTPDQPVDSSGAMGSVNLDFSSDKQAAALALAAPSIDIGGGLTVTDARVSIAAIKLKAEKSSSKEEDEFKQLLKEKKKIFEKEIEANKKSLEKQKEDLKQAFETTKEGKNNSEIEMLKRQLETDIAGVKKQIATIEKVKDLKEQEFEAENDKNIKWKGPYLYNLISDTLTPALPAVQIIDGSYKRIEFKVKPNRTVESTDILLNNSIVIAGSFNAIPYVISFPMSHEFKMSGAGAFVVSPDGVNKLNVSFSLVDWFAGVDMNKAIVANGTIEISEKSNKVIFDIIRKNVKASTKFGKDNDGDSLLKKDEFKGDGKENIEALELEEKKLETERATEEAEKQL